MNFIIGFAIFLAIFATDLNATISLNLPTVKPQNDDWSCGINVATRMLKGYRHSITYDGLKQRIGSYSFKASKQIKLLGFKKKISKPINIAIGKPTRKLVADLKRIDNTATYAEKSSLNRIITLLKEKKPLGTLLLLREKSWEWKNSGMTIMSTKIPSLHWVVLVGVDEKSKKVFYYDTYSDKKYDMSFDEFMQKWDWKLWKSRNSMLYNYITQVEKLSERTIFWFNKPLP